MGCSSSRITEPEFCDDSNHSAPLGGVGLDTEALKNYYKYYAKTDPSQDSINSIPSKEDFNDHYTL